MDELIIRSLMGETTAEEARRLMRWRAESAENDAHYRSLAATWELAGHARILPQLEPPTAAAIIARARREPWSSTEAPPGETSAAPARRRRWWPAGVGLLAVAATAAALLLGSPFPSGGAMEPAAAAPYWVAGDEARTLHLVDGSAVHLEIGSRLRIDPSQPRTVRLDGRAYFGIARQDDRPFIVRSSAGETRVLGTRFELTARGDDLRIVVVEGRVEVVSETGEAEVGAGEESRVVDGGEPVVERADYSNIRSWLGDVFIFQNTPLDAVAQELEAHFDRPIILEDPRLADRTVTAVFADASLEEILPALCRAVDARCITGPDAVRITH